MSCGSGVVAGVYVSLLISLRDLVMGRLAFAMTIGR